MGWFSNFLSTDLAIDLGTANTLVYLKGRGIVVNEPSVVAVTRDARGNPQVLAVGRQAKEMLGKTPGSIEAIRPLKDGVIADFEITGVMLKYFIQKAMPRRTLLRPRIIVCIPYGITEVEKRAVRESTMSAGAREVFLIEEPMAAAIGAGLPVHEPSGNMVIDIGGGTTDIAVISLGGIVYSRSVRVGGDKTTEAIQNYIKKKYNLLLGEQRAEQVKLDLGNAFPDPSGVIRTMEIKGRDLIAGVPKIIQINSDEVREAIQEPVNTIVTETKITLERTPPELAADIVDKGIIMTGGGSLLRNLDVLLREETGLPVMLSEDPMTAVVNGSGMALEQIDSFKGAVI